MASMLKHVGNLSRQLNGRARLEICSSRESRKKFTRHYHKFSNICYQLRCQPCSSFLFNSSTTSIKLGSQYRCCAYTLRNNSSSAPNGPEDISPFIENIIGSTNEDSIINTDNIVNADSILNTINYIPEPPPIPVPIDIAETLQLVGEPSFVSLDLGHWTPVGLVELSLEFLHTSLGIPWWLSIVLGTVIIRIALLPVMIKIQRNVARMNNNLPQMQLLQLKMTEARKSGNNMETARYGNELMIFMKKKGLNPITNMLWPLFQAPIFVSFFFALRKMANLPVESLKYGGLWWFSNLTIPDPFYILPILTSVTLFITLEVAAEGGVRTANLQGMRYILRAIPLIILPFTASFPTTVLCYWVTSNSLSLIIASVLKMPKIREYCKIEKLIHHNPENLPVKKKGMVESFKESMSNARVSAEMEDRHRVAALKFRQSGMGPIQKTYPYDPTKQASASPTSAKDKTL